MAKKEAKLVSGQVNIKLSLSILPDLEIYARLWNSKLRLQTWTWTCRGKIKWNEKKIFFVCVRTHTDALNRKNWREGSIWSTNLYRFWREFVINWDISREDSTSFKSHKDLNAAGLYIFLANLNFYASFVTERDSVYPNELDLWSQLWQIYKFLLFFRGRGCSGRLYEIKRVVRNDAWCINKPPFFACRQTDITGSWCNFKR